MSNLREFKQALSAISRLWKDKDYDAALAEVESLLRRWPGNAQLHILWASLVQLQEAPEHGLDKVKEALQHAVELDKRSPAAAIELGHFLDNVEDDPQAASKVYAEVVAAARQMLLEALVGQAKALRQLGEKDEFLRCLVEVLHLVRSETDPSPSKTGVSRPDIIFESPSGHFHVFEMKGPHAEQIQDLLSEMTAIHSA